MIRVSPVARRRLLWLLGCALVVAMTASAVYAYSQRSLRRQYADEKARALAAARAGDARAAVGLLTHYVRRYPDDAEAYAAYADCRPLVDPQSTETRQQTATALKHLLQLQPGRDEWRRRLLALYIEANADDEALRMAGALLARHPNEVPALQQTALIRARRAEWPAALVASEKWIALSPLELDARLIYLQACKSTGTSPSEIVSRAVKWRQEHAGDPRFELLEAVALNVTQTPHEPPSTASPSTPADPRGPAEWLRLAASRVSPSDDFTQILVREMERAGLFDDALAVLRREATGPGPRDPSQLARRLWESGNWQELVTRLGADPAAVDKLSASCVGYLGLSLHALARDAEIDALRPTLRARPTDPVAACWLAVWDQMAGTKSVDPTVLAGLCRAALNRDHHAVLFRYLLAESLARVGQPEVAIEELRRVLNDDLTWTASASRLAELLLETGNLSAAVEVANEARRRAAAGLAPGGLHVAAVLVRVWSAAIEDGLADRPEELESLAAAVQREDQGEPYSLRLAVAGRVRAGDRGGAARLLIGAINRTRPIDEPTLLEYASISREYALAIEEAAFARGTRDHGPTPALVYARAVALRDNGDVPGGRRLLVDARAAAPSREWDLAVPRYLDLTRDPGASAAWVKLADGNPGDVAVQRAALESHFAAIDRAFADRTIDRLQTLEGDSAVGWRLARARWRFMAPDARRADFEEAALLSTQVLARCPNYAAAHWLLGRCLRRLDDNVAALDHLDAAARLNPTEPDLQLDLARTLIDRGLSARARILLDRLQRPAGASAMLLTRVAYLYELNGSPADAERLYRRALATDPHLVLAQNNLAMILAKKGIPHALGEAVGWAAKAVHSWPEVAAVYDTLAFAQWKAGQPEVALKTLDAAIALPHHDRASDVRRVTLLLDTHQIAQARLALTAIEVSSPERLSPALRGELQQAKDRLATHP